MSTYAANLNGVFAKPKRPVESFRPGLQMPTGGFSIAPGRQKEYLQLKEKIMRTDELIQRYRQKAGECERYKQQLKDLQTKLSIEEKGRKGLAAELSILHKEGEVLKKEKEAAGVELEKLQLTVKEGELVKQQLTVQVADLKGAKETSKQLKEELNTSKTEMERYKRMYQKLKQEYEVYKAEQRANRSQRRRRPSEANSLPTPVISPPPSDAVLSPLSTCSLPLPLSNSTDASVRAQLPSRIEQNLDCPDVNFKPLQIDPGAGLTLNEPTEINDHLDRDTHNVDVGNNSSNLETIDIGSTGGSGVPKSDYMAGDDRCTVVSDNNVRSVADVVVSRLSDDSDSEGGEENVTTSHDKCTCVDNKNVWSIPDVIVGRLSDDSDSEEENAFTSATTCYSSVKQTPSDLNAPLSALVLSDNSNSEDNVTVSSKTCHSSKKESSSEQNTLTDSDNVHSISQGDQLDNNSSKVPPEVPYSNHDTDDVQASVKTAVGSGQSFQELTEYTSVEQKSLNTELFGDYDDSLSHLSVSDSSSCCSLSSVGSVDNLADLLHSTTGVQDEDIPKVQPGGQSGMDSCTHVKEAPVTCMCVEKDDAAGTELRIINTYRGEQMTPLAIVHGDYEHDAKPSPLSPKTDEEKLQTGGASSDFVAVEDSKAACSRQDVHEIKEDNHMCPCLPQTLASRTAVPHMHTTGFGGDLSSGPSCEGVPTDCQGQFVSLPRIEVEAVVADTASSEDSDCEMDISLLAPFGDDFQVISPLPPSPFNSHISSLSAPLSPLPPSPAKRQLLSPLPQTPHQELELISPLPPSPVNASHSLLSPVASPSLQTLDGAHHHFTTADSESSGGGSRENDASPVQFDDVAPVNVQVPKPCNLSISVQTCLENSTDVVSPRVTGSTDTTPSPRSRKLHVSETSPFSPLTFVLPLSTQPISVFSSSPVTPAAEGVPIFEAVSLTKTLESASTSDGATAVVNSTTTCTFNSLQTSKSSPLKQHLSPTGGGGPLLESVPLSEATSSDVSPAPAAASSLSLSSLSKEGPMPTKAVPDQALEVALFSQTAANSVASTSVTISTSITSEARDSSPSKQPPEVTESVTIFEAKLLAETIKSSSTPSDDGCSGLAIDPLLENNFNKVEEKKNCKENTKITDVPEDGLKLEVKSENQLVTADIFEKPEKSEGWDSYGEDVSGETVLEASEKGRAATCADDGEELGDTCTSSDNTPLVSRVDGPEALTTNEISAAVKLDKIKEAAVAEFIHQVRELDQKSRSVNLERRGDSDDVEPECTEAELFGNPAEAGDDRDSVTELGSGGVSPLILEVCGHFRSQMEEGEKKHSEEDERNIVGEAIEVIHQVLDLESVSIKTERRVDSDDVEPECTEAELFGNPEKAGDDNVTELGGGGVSPLSLEHRGHSRSPVEEGEISESEEEDRDKVGEATKVIHQVRELDLESDSVKAERRVDSDNVEPECTEAELFGNPEKAGADNVTELGGGGVSPLSLEHRSHSRSPVEEGEISESEEEDRDKVGKATKVIHQVRELDLESDSVKTERRVDSDDVEPECTEAELFGNPSEAEDDDVTELGSGRVSPLTLEHHGHSSSPAEEGEISESEEEAADKVDKGSTAPSPEKDKQTAATCTCIADTELIQNSSHSPISTPNQLPHDGTVCKSIPKSNTRSRQTDDACYSAVPTSCTFDSLLKSFRSNMVRGKKKGNTVKTYQLRSKPLPLARFTSAARSRNSKSKNSSQPCAPLRAADFIGRSVVTNPPSTISPDTDTTDCAQSCDYHVTSRGTGKPSKARRLSGEVAFVRDDQLAVPISKRPKVEDALSEDTCLSEQRTPPHLGGAMIGGGDGPQPEATSPKHLPGYMYHLRSRNVTKFQILKRKRRINSSSDGEQPTWKKRRNSNSISGPDPEAEDALWSNPVELTRNNNCSENKEGKLVGSRSCSSSTGSAIENCNAELCVKSSSQQLPSDNASNREFPPHGGGGSGDGRCMLEPFHKVAVRKLNATPSTTIPQPMAAPTLADKGQLTSVLTDSCQLDGTDDSDDALVIGDLYSLLDDEDSQAPSPLPPSPQCLFASTLAKPKPHVRKTDSATGQEEDQTPASSPKTWTDVISNQLLSLSERKGVQATGVASNLDMSRPSTSSSCQSTMQPCPSSTGEAAAKSIAAATCVNFSAVGYGKPQAAPLPEYTRPISNHTRSKCSISNSDCQASSSRIIDVDEIFHTPLPLLEKSTKGSGTGRREGLRNELSLAQRELTICMQSPLPLPHWLVAAMTRVQSKHEHCAASGMGLSKKKRGSAKEPIMRQSKQKIVDYIMINLERLVCGHLHLSTVLTMFTHPKNVPSLKDFVSSTLQYLLTRYNPKIEHVVSVFHTLCDSVRGNCRDVDPYDSRFPPALLRPECQMVALFAQMYQLSSVMAPLLVEVSKALYQALVTQPLKFHKLSALGRILTAICRLQGDSDRVLFLAFDLLKKPLTVIELPVIAGLASVWPTPFARKRGIKLLENNPHQVLLRGLEQQPLSYTLEVLVMTMMQSGDTHGNLPLNLHTLCKWSAGTYKEAKITALTEALIGLLKDSDGVYIVSASSTTGASGSTQWHRPRPSVLAFHIVHCLRMISHLQGWVWTNDTLIRAHLWPLLQQWNSKQDTIREATVVCSVRVIGFIAQPGLSQDVESSSIGQLQRVLVALLNKSDQVSFPIQLAAVDSLLDLSPPNHPRRQELLGVVRAWLKQQCGKPHGIFLVQEFSPRLVIT